jgi:hypothetical protein
MLRFVAIFRLSTLLICFLLTDPKVHRQPGGFAAAQQKAEAEEAAAAAAAGAEEMAKESAGVAARQALGEQSGRLARVTNSTPPT